ncbi:hypothetical protein J7M23_09025 [Candidatus Sumerlaeota bacterium]|nr:hypothetical protein [Candidatus Sumerlaeota bacterium]
MAHPRRKPLYYQQIGELALSWLIPGSGFLIHRDNYRGVTIMGLLTATFLLGLSLKGTVVFPVWSPSKEGFNVINILTFLAQMGYGSLGLLCLASHWLGMRFFQGDQSYAFFDLATFYLIIAGALNYLMLFNLYDRHLKPERAKEATKKEK